MCVAWFVPSGRGEAHSSSPPCSPSQLHHFPLLRLPRQEAHHLRAVREVAARGRGCWEGGLLPQLEPLAAFSAAWPCRGHSRAGRGLGASVLGRGPWLGRAQLQPCLVAVLPGQPLGFSFGDPESQVWAPPSLHPGKAQGEFPALWPYGLCLTPQLCGCSRVATDSVEAAGLCPNKASPLRPLLSWPSPVLARGSS